MVIPLDRREFLGLATTSALVLGLPRAQGNNLSANEKLQIGIIGTANRANANIADVAHENIVAVCDVDSNYLHAAQQRFPKAKGYRDFRKLLEQKGIDAVVVSTADHTHAPAAAMAIRQGLHVYCEKPLSHSVHEARVLAELAAKHKVATQMGTQIHASENYRRVVEVIQSGAIGPVRAAHVWCDKTWSNGKFRVGQAPAHLDWDLWLGPAPQRPYSENVHPANWRRFWDYGGGTLGDMACHLVDVVFWALELRHPTSVWAEGPPVDPVGTPAWIIVHYEFPARGSQPAVQLTWSDGGKKPDILHELNEGGGKLARWGMGQLFIGDKGMLASNYDQLILLPKDRFADYKRPSPTIPRSVGHHREWLNACKTGSPTTCNFDYAGALTESVLLGNVAYRLGQKINWDAIKLQATNAPQADQFIQREYRKGWTL